MGLFALHILQSPSFIIPWLPLHVNNDFGRCLILPILRHSHERYLAVPSELLRNEKLSLRDKGLLCYMLNLPDDWRFSIRGLSAVLERDGRSAIESSLRSIEQAGYIKRDKIHTQDGKLDWVWQISDTPEFSPCTDCPDMAKPAPVQPDTGILSEQNYLMIELPKHKESASRFTSPSAEQVLSYAKQNSIQIDAGAFVDFYASKGWKVGRSPMKDWRAAVRNWARRSGSSQTEAQAGGPGSDFELVSEGGVQKWQRKR